MCICMERLHIDMDIGIGIGIGIDIDIGIEIEIEMYKYIYLCTPMLQTQPGDSLAKLLSSRKPRRSSSAMARGSTSQGMVWR